MGETGSAVDESVAMGVDDEGNAAEAGCSTATGVLVRLLALSAILSFAAADKLSAGVAVDGVVGVEEGVAAAPAPLAATAGVTDAGTAWLGGDGIGNATCGGRDCAKPPAAAARLGCIG